MKTVFKARVDYSDYSIEEFELVKETECFITIIKEYPCKRKEVIRESKYNNIFGSSYKYFDTKENAINWITDQSDKKLEELESKRNDEIGKIDRFINKYEK